MSFSFCTYILAAKERASKLKVLAAATALLSFRVKFIVSNFAVGLLHKALESVLKILIAAGSSHLTLRGALGCALSRAAGG
jgi:hypothetical protein